MKPLGAGLVFLAFLSGYPVLAIVTTALMLIGTPLAGDLTNWPGGERVPT